MDQGSTMKRSAVHNFAPTVTRQALPHDTKFGNSRCEIIGRRVIFIWSLIHGSSWSGLIKVGPGHKPTGTAIPYVTPSLIFLCRSYVIDTKLILVTTYIGWIKHGVLITRNVRLIWIIINYMLVFPCSIILTYIVYITPRINSKSHIVFVIHKT